MAVHKTSKMKQNSKNDIVVFWKFSCCYRALVCLQMLQGESLSTMHVTGCVNKDIKELLFSKF